MRAFVEKRPPRYTDPYGDRWPFPTDGSTAKSKK